MDTAKIYDVETNNPIVCAECGWSKRYCDCKEFIPEFTDTALQPSDFDEETPNKLKTKPI